MNHARDWSTRIVDEASLHEESCFCTLTYSDQHLPDPPEVSRRAMQLFLKRLRKAIAPTRIRFFLCGEYGSKVMRPHYHVLIFGWSFLKDRYLWSEIRGNLYYRSPLLETIWPYGLSNISDVTTQSAGYVARYSVKKANDFTAHAGNPYQRVNAQTGEVYTVAKEFIGMSTSPGIGFGWLDQFASDLVPSGFSVVNGRKRPMPKAYKKRILNKPDKFDPALVEQLDKMQMDQFLRTQTLEARADNTCERIATKAELLQLRAAELKRDLE